MTAGSCSGKDSRCGWALPGDQNNDCVTYLVLLKQTCLRPERHTFQFLQRFQRNAVRKVLSRFHSLKKRKTIN